MQINEKFQINGVVFHSPTNYDQWASVKPLSEKCDLDKRLIYAEGRLIQIVVSVRPKLEAEFPSYMVEKNGVKFDRHCTTIAEYKDGELIMHEDFDSDGYDYNSIGEAIDFAMDVLNDKNPYLYRVLTHSTAVNHVNMMSLCNGLFSILIMPKKMTVIETMAKTHGEKMAINSLQNDIEIAGGKKAAVLTEKQIGDIKTLKLDASLKIFQNMVLTNVLSIEQMNKVLQGLKYLIKFKFITAGELDDLMSRHGEDIVNKKMNFEVILANTIKSFFDLYDISGKSNYYRSGYYYYNSVHFKNLFSHYVDAINMLPGDEPSMPKYYRTNDVEKYHGITVRNSRIYQKPREEEFKKAIARLRKLTYDDGTYYFAPFQTEEELFHVGQQYNNCLPVYRDKIIDNGAILICAYKKTATGLEDCPDFVFEVTPYLDVLEISTYNNEEVTDPDRVEAVRAFRKAKWYLLSKGRTVFREPDEKDEETNE